MSLSAETKLHVDHVASDSLRMLSRVAEIAASQSAGKGLSVDSLTTINTLNSEKVAQALAHISLAQLESSRALAREPAVARVVVLDESGSQRLYYICRGTPVLGAPALLASRNAPVGRLASLPVGEVFRLPNGELVEVLERTLLRPSKHADGWDSRNSIIEGEKFGPLTIDSFRSLLREVGAPVKEILSQILAKDAEEIRIFEGVRRDRIIKMGLRDQPVLDQYQDEIFRLPLDQRLLLLGPPGTGKTTTLIRRLGQKLDITAPDSLTSDERRIIDNMSQSGNPQHAESWQMFTPTLLLKQYLKEAFAREGIPASDRRLKTWTEYRHELGRNVMSILRMPGAGGYFTLKEFACILADDAIDRPIEWFEDFNSSQQQAFVRDLHQGVQVLVKAGMPQISSLGKRIADILEHADASAMPSLFIRLQAETGTLDALVRELRDASERKIDDALNLALNSNDRFLDELGQFIDQLHTSVDMESEYDDIDADAEDEDVALPKTGRGPAIKAFRIALKVQARADAAKRSISKTSRSARVVDWLGERTLKAGDRATVGAQLLLLSSARRFVNPVKRYLDGMSKRYRFFRRERQESGSWYSAEQFATTHLHPLELDVILLSSLRAAGEMLSRPTIARRIEEPYWATLQTVNGLYKNQILVDEVTDFSPIQLACIAALAHPVLRSFFACGDFNQRLTTWGSRSVSEMRWIFPKIDVRHVSVSYRQSRQLNELARAIIQVLGGDVQDESLPIRLNNEGEAPVLLEGAAMDNAVPWLADQIRNIAGYLQQLPSTAVFVNNEAEVQLLAEALNAVLEDDNIRVVACPKGQVMGNDNDVRVFDIQHIKGLEFEAVFFVGIDQLAKQHPALFDKYLYVGTTRAATYLGVTCEAHLPESMEPLRPHFVSELPPR
jgi:DNA polymerase III delta prime subunit